MTAFVQKARTTPSERLRSGLFFVAFLGLGAYWTMGATVGDTLFLSALAAEGAAVTAFVPWVYVAIGAGAAAAVSLFAALQQRLPRLVVTVGTPIVLAASVCGLGAVLPSLGIWGRFALVVWLEVVALLALMLHFSVAGDHFTSRDAKRFYGPIGAGLPVGVLVGGAIVSPLVSAIGTAGILYVAAAVMAVVAGIWAAVARFVPRVGEPEADDAGKWPANRIWRDRYLLLLAALSFLSPFLFACIDLVLMVLVSGWPEDEMARFFGALYGGIGGAEILVQLLLAERLMRRIGVLNILTLYPLAIGTCGAIFLAFPSVALATVANVLRAVIGETLDTPSRELLWLPVPVRIRQVGQAVASGAVAPLGQGMAGLLLAGLFAAGADLAASAASACLGSAVLLLSIWALRSRYRAKLAEALRLQHVDELDLTRLLLTPGNEAAARALLGSNDPAIATFTRELLARPDALGAESDALSEWEATDPREGRVVEALAAARRLISTARSPQAYPGLVERQEEVLAHLRVLSRATEEIALDVAPLLRDHHRLHVDLLLCLLALSGNHADYYRVRRNLYTESHGEALDLLDELLPRSRSPEILAAVEPPAPAGTGLSPESRSVLESGGRWLHFLAAEPSSPRLPTVERVLQLKAIGVFAGVEADFLVPVADLVEDVALIEGQRLVSSGEPGDAVYLVRTGSLHVLAGARVAARLGPTDCVGEMALFDGAPRSATVVAAADSRLLKLDGIRFQALLPEQPALVRALLRILSERLAAAEGPGLSGAAADWHAASGEEPGTAPALSQLVSRAAFIRQLPLFGGLSPGHVASVARLCRPRPVYEGETVFRQGDPGDALFVIQAGRVVIGDAASPLAVLGPRDHLGEMALLSGSSRSATATAIEEGALLRIRAADFDNLLAVSPTIGVELLRSLAARLRAATLATR